MLVLLFCFSLVSITESKHKGKNGLLKDVCIWISLYRRPCLAAVYPRNAQHKEVLILWPGYFNFLFVLNVVSA